MSKTLSNFTFALISVCICVYILIIGKTLILPFIIGIVFWYFIIILMGFYQSAIFKGKDCYRALSMALAVITYILVLWIVGIILSDSIKDIANNGPLYQSKFENMASQIDSFLQVNGMSTVDSLLESINFTAIFSSIAQAITSVAGYMTMIIIYVIFLLIEYRSFDKKIKALFPENKSYSKAISVIDTIALDVNTYMRVKIGVSVLTAILSYIILISFGVDFAAFWAILIFILNFIPNIGSIIAVFFPVVIALIQFDSIATVVALAVLLFAVQFSIGNVLEPKLMGSTLNLSALVILIALAFWGAIWGIIGMILCVPITVILNIILSKFEATHNLAILLSSQGKVKK